MYEWWQKTGHSLGIGKSEYSIRSREVLMCSWRYAADIPLRLPNTQLPPTRSDASKTVNGMPHSCSALAAAMPDEPAPMTAAVGYALTGRQRISRDDTGVSFSPAGVAHRRFAAWIPATGVAPRV